MDKQMKDIFCKLIDVELDKISKLPNLNDATLNNLHKLTDTKKNLLKIDKLEMEMMGGGNSFGYYGNAYGNSYGNSYAGNAYANNSYAQNQGGNSNGYSMGNDYSRMDGRSHLEAAMRDARSEQEREEIRQLMSRYHI